MQAIVNTRVNVSPSDRLAVEENPKCALFSA